MYDIWRVNKPLSKMQLYITAFLIGFFIVLLFWLLESYLHTVYFQNTSFINNLWPKAHHEIWMRAVPSIFVMLFSILICFLLNQKLQLSNEFGFAMVALNVMREAVLITDSNNKIVYVNKRYEQISGYSLAEVVGKNPNILSSGKQNKAFYHALWKDLAQNGFWEGEMWNRRKSGELYPEWITITTIKNYNDEIVYHLAVFSDISVRKEAEEKIRYFALNDPLTKIPNRNFFEETLKQASRKHKRRPEQLALLFLDLDGFKPINDTYGHNVGDEVLTEFALRLQAAVREGDFIARLGGDEFIVMMSDIGNKAEAENVAQRCLNIVQKPFEIDVYTVSVGVSIGVAFADEVSSDPHALLSLADQRMYKAKKNGKNSYIM